LSDSSESGSYSVISPTLLTYLRPVYAGDIARAVEICCRDDPQVLDAVGGRVIEAGGPDGECACPRRGA
jgi:hypothetical protein